MTIASVIIQQAYREGNLIPAGQQPTTAEQTEALMLLNNYMLAVFGAAPGEIFTDWPVPAPQRTGTVAANYPQLPYPMGLDAQVLPAPYSADLTQTIYNYPPSNSRIVFGSVTDTAYFPEAPNDGACMSIAQGSGAGDGGTAGQILTLDGNGRTIEGTNTKTYTAPLTARTWMYRADLADWIYVGPLALTDNLYFPSDLDDLWITALAMRLAPRYAKPTAPETVALYKNMMINLRTQYKQAGTTVYGSQAFPRSLQSYASGRWYW